MSDNFQHIIDLWPRTTAFAADIGVLPTTAQKWRDRDSIPSPYWTLVVWHANERGYNVTLERLANIAAEK